MTFDEYTNPQADYTYDYASRNNRSISNLNRLGIAPRLYGNPNRVNPSADTNIPAAEIINEVVNNAGKNVSSSTGVVVANLLFLLLVPLMVLKLLLHQMLKWLVLLMA